MKSGLVIAVLASVLSAVSYSAHISAQDRTSGQALNAFLSTQEDRNAARLGALRLRSLGGSVEAIVETILSGAVVLPSPPPEIPPLVKTRLQRVFAQDLAQYALALGLDESVLHRNPNALRSISRIMRGQAGTEDYILGADTIVIAVAAGKDFRSLKDGYLSGNRFVVLDSVKGGLGSGHKIVLRQRSGAGPDGLRVAYSNDISPVQGQKYLLFLSRSYYLQSSLEHNPRFSPSSSPGTVDAMLIAGAYEIHPSKIKSITPGAPSIQTLDQLRAKVHSVSINQAAHQ